MNTKEKIADKALALFSKKGYNAVSIRDICGVVGIKESTIYYHFKNKKAILDHLAENFELSATHLMTEFTQSVRHMENPRPGALTEFAGFFVEKYLLVPALNQFFRVLIIEQGADKGLRQLYHKWLFDVPLLLMSSLFKKLMAAGAIKEYDGDYLATSFYALLFLDFERHLIHGDLKAAQKNEFTEIMRERIENFLDVFAV